MFERGKRLLLVAVGILGGMLLFKYSCAEDEKIAELIRRNEHMRSIVDSLETIYRLKQATIDSMAWRGLQKEKYIDSLETSHRLKQATIDSMSREKLWMQKDLEALKFLFQSGSTPSVRDTINVRPFEGTPKVEISRYPTMECPNSVLVGKEFAVQVSLTEELITESVKVISGIVSTEGRLSLSLPEQEVWQIDVVWYAPDFSIIEGTNISSFILPREGDSPPAIFYLRANSISGMQQSAKIYASLWYNQGFLARIVREVIIERFSEKKTTTKRESIHSLASDLRTRRVELTSQNHKVVVNDDRDIPDKSWNLKIKLPSAFIPIFSDLFLTNFRNRRAYPSSFNHTTTNSRNMKIGISRRYRHLRRQIH